MSGIIKWIAATSVALLTMTVPNVSGSISTYGAAMLSEDAEEEIYVDAALNVIENTDTECTLHITLDHETNITRQEVEEWKQELEQEVGLAFVQDQKQNYSVEWNLRDTDGGPISEVLIRWAEAGCDSTLHSQES